MEKKDRGGEGGGGYKWSMKRSRDSSIGRNRSMSWSRSADISSQLVTVFLRDAMTVEEFLAAGCIKKGLSPVEHFIR